MEGPEAVQGVGTVFRLAKERYFWTLLVYLAYLAAVMIGTIILCLPGIAAAILLLPCTYLISATDTDFVSAFKRAYQLVLQNIAMVLALVGIVIVLSLVLACGTGVVNFVVALVFGLIGGAVGSQTVVMIAPTCGAPLIGLIVQLIVGFPILATMGGFLTAMDLADSGTDIVEDEPAAA